MSKVKQKRAESPMFSIAQGNALGIRYLRTMRPVRATLCGTIELPLQGAWVVFIRYPGRCPGLWRYWAFSPHLYGYKVFSDNAPCKGNFKIPLFLQLPLQGAWVVFILIPRAMPWAVEILGFQPAFV